MRVTWKPLLAFGVLLALPAFGQEAQEQEPARDDRPHIQVLRDPYDLASFYRSSSSPSRGFVYGYGSRPYGDAYGLIDERGFDSGWLRPGRSGPFFGPHWTSGFGVGFELRGSDGWGRGWSGWRRSLRGWDDSRPLRRAPGNR